MINSRWNSRHNFTFYIVCGSFVKQIMCFAKGECCPWIPYEFSLKFWFFFSLVNPRSYLSGVRLLSPFRMFFNRLCVDLTSSKNCRAPSQNDPPAYLNSWFFHWKPLQYVPQPSDILINLRLTSRLVFIS